jgi:hypothetical protein
LAAAEAAGAGAGFGFDAISSCEDQADRANITATAIAPLIGNLLFIFSSYMRLSSNR